jgi:hypothetical protein
VDGSTGAAEDPGPAADDLGPAAEGSGSGRREGEGERAGCTTTGPVDTGGMKGTSSAPAGPLSMVAVPAVMTARVGSEASATSSATIITYRRVGPENP